MNHSKTRFIIYLIACKYTGMFFNNKYNIEITP